MMVLFITKTEALFPQRSNKASPCNDTVSFDITRRRKTLSLVCPSVLNTVGGLDMTLVESVVVVPWLTQSCVALEHPALLSKEFL